MELKRRDLLAGVPTAGLAAALAEGAALGQVKVEPGDLYRVDDPARIIAAAKAIIAEDSIGVLITIDSDGMPRARPVGVSDPSDDWSLWIATRRLSRKTRQILANPKAALHFGFDDTANGHAKAYYASFTGLASVHTDAATIAAYGPPPAYRGGWPDYPRDVAVIRFKPTRLEVQGKGISPSKALWQPQGVVI